jgi:hypothetical protein
MELIAAPKPTVPKKASLLRSLPRPKKGEAAPYVQVPQSYVYRRREECFFGLHFDFHAETNDTEIGASVTEDLVRRIIRRSRPDFIQYDCKGHSGIASYPSQVAPQPARIARNALAIYRRVSAEMNVGLYGHFSGIWNSHALDADRSAGVTSVEGLQGEVFPHVRSEFVHPLSTFGPYVHRIMIPEMRELVDLYALDGLWVDADCWAAQVDYCDAAQSAFNRRYPDTEVPRSPSEPYWKEWLAIQRAQFVRYVQTYTHALHTMRPSLQVASNWLHGPIAPEPPGESGVDFISGDYSAADPVRRARMDSRFMAGVGVPWDLLAWGFCMSDRGEWVCKETRLLQREAAEVITQGGGFQVYFQPDRQGGFREDQIEQMGEVADFCHTRRESCHRTQSIPQVAVLFDRQSHYADHTRPFGPCDPTFLESVVDAISASGHSVDLVPDYRLLNELDRWPVVVIPGWKHLSDESIAILLTYAHRGGSLCVVGDEPANLFDVAISKQGPWTTVSDAQQRMIGKGKIAFIRHHVVDSNSAPNSSVLECLFRSVLEELYTPIVSCEPQSRFEVVLRKRDLKTIVHLLNRSAETSQDIQANVSAGGCTVTVSATDCPSAVWMEPGHMLLTHQWHPEKRRFTVHVPDVSIHAAIVFGVTSGHAKEVVGK